MSEDLAAAAPPHSNELNEVSGTSFSLLIKLLSSLWVGSIF